MVSVLTGMWNFSAITETLPEAENRFAFSFVECNHLYFILPFLRFRLVYLNNGLNELIGNENVTRKYIFISFVLLRDYFNSLNFYKNGELSRNQIGRSGVQVKKENEKFTAVRSRSPQNLKCGHFTLLFCRERQEMYQNVKRTCRAIVFAH